MIFASEIASAVTEREARDLAEAAKDKIVLEVGSWHGRSTIALASTALVVHAVDWHQGDDHAGHEETLGTYMANLKRYGIKNVITHVGMFEDVAPFLQPKFAFAFLDSYHERETVARHMLFIDSLMRDYGMGVEIATHDFVQGTFGPELVAGCDVWRQASLYEWRGPRIVDSTAFWKRGAFKI